MTACPAMPLGLWRAEYDAALATGMSVARRDDQSSWQGSGHREASVTECHRNTFCVCSSCSDLLEDDGKQLSKFAGVGALGCADAIAWAALRVT